MTEATNGAGNGVNPAQEEATVPVHVCIYKSQSNELQFFRKGQFLTIEGALRSLSNILAQPPDTVCLCQRATSTFGMTIS